MKIPPEILKHYITNLNFTQIISEIPEYLQKQLETANKMRTQYPIQGQDIDIIYDDMVEYIWRFDLLHLKLDWMPILKRLLVYNDRIII